VARAREEGQPLTLRAGGSGLAGQTVGTGLVADVSRYLHRIVSVDVARRETVVQPGVVLADLNRTVAPQGLTFAPDPSSGDFCCIGGMLANNSKGARSVKYGTTSQHVNWVRMLLADGSEVLLQKGFREAADYHHGALRAVAERLAARRGDILARWPRSKANTSGYNLKECLGPDGSVDLLPLFVGSEGTLAIFLEAGLDLTPLAEHRALAMVEFGELDDAGRAVLELLPLGPSACELMGETFLEIIRRGEGKFPLGLDARSKAILLVEGEGETREAAEEALAGLLRAARGARPLGVRRAADAAERAAIWAFRKAASPLLNRGRGRLKSIRFIEDGAVPTENIPAYMRGVGEILGARGIEVVIFGHAGDGNFHVNPFMDLKDPYHFRQMPLIAREVAQLQADLNGTLSGEHGDGRLRTPFLPMVYGDLCDLFREIKLLLDPQEILNPGIIAPSEPEPMETGLRVHPGRESVRLPGRLSEDSWATEAERCHGCGTCRDFCPTAQATDDDLLSSRGRANLLQALLEGDLSPREARARGVRSVFDSCLGCSQCELHCPTRVDIAPLAAAFREAFTPPLQRARDRFLGAVPSLGYVLGPTLLGAAGKVGGSLPGRWTNAAALGLRLDLKAPEASPVFSFDPGRLYRFPGRGKGKVVYYYGCYGNTYNPSGEAALAVAVLGALGVEVVVPPQACCGVSKMARGLFDSVAEDALFTQRGLLPFVREGFSVVVSAPSCLLALAKEQPRFFPSSEATELAGACIPLFTYLERLLGQQTPVLSPVRRRVVYQTPCHGAVLGTWREEVAVLGRIPGLELVDVTEECCGLAGSFGAEARHGGLSDAVAAPLYARIRAAAPDALVTPCGSCRTQDEARVGLKVHHPLALLAESLGIQAPTDLRGHECAVGKK